MYTIKYNFLLINMCLLSYKVINHFKIRNKILSIEKVHSFIPFDIIIM